MPRRATRPDPPASVHFPNLEEELADAFDAAYKDAAEAWAGIRRIGSVAGEGVAKGAAAYGRDRAGELITSIDETTRDEINAEIQSNLDDPVALKQALRDGFPLSEDRAEMIARTETRTAYNLGTVKALMDAGEEYVYVSDGDDWDEACADADGEIWTLEEAEANPLEHPNCEREFRPLTEDELAEVLAEEGEDEAGAAAEEEMAALRGLVFYSDDEPRDEGGKWTVGGEGGTSALAHAWPEERGHPDYLYHATSDTNLRDIADEGLHTHGPSYGTDQSTWPDGATERRSYWTEHPHIASSFSPENGKPVLVRVARDKAAFRRESGTGDHYTRTKIDAKHVEVLGGDGKWRGLASVKGKFSRVADFAEYARELLAAGFYASEVREVRAQFYSEDEPRDERGRWTTGGESEGAGVPGGRNVTDKELGDWLHAAMEKHPGLSNAKALALARQAGMHVSKESFQQHFKRIAEDRIKGITTHDPPKFLVHDRVEKKPPAPPKETTPPQPPGIPPGPGNVVEKPASGPPPSAPGAKYPSAPSITGYKSYVIGPDVVKSIGQKIPEHHLDGLRSIAFNDRVIGGQASWIGMHSWSSAGGTIQVAMRGAGQTGQWDKWSREHMTTFHEIGHHVHLTKLTNEAAREWGKISRTTPKYGRVTSYAGKNHAEHFAETYGHWHTSAESREHLRATEPAAYAFMERLHGSGVKSMVFPNGTRNMSHEEFMRRRSGGTPRGWRRRRWA